MKIKLLFFSLIFYFSCVGLPDADHGLVENLPVIINESNVFSFVLRADNFTYDESFDINVIIETGQFLVSTLIVTDYKGNDTTSIQLTDANSSNIYNYEITRNLVTTNDEKNDIPNKAILDLNSFTGILEWVVTNK